jgi:tetratricopeptide (TPR) repeat protein
MSLRHSLALVACLSLLPGLAAAHGDLHEQIAALSQRIARDPANPDLLLRRGELHRQHRDWEAALADYDRAARLAPALPVVDYLRALVWLESGTPEQALSALDRFLAQQPNHGDAHVARARALRRLGRPRDAADELGRALALLSRPTPDHYLEHARALADADDLDGAVAALDDGQARLGRVVSLQLAAVDLEVRRERWDAALMRLERTAAATAPAGMVRRASILERAGRHDEARRAYAGAAAAIERLPESRRRTRATDALSQEIQAALARLTARSSTP